MDELSGFQMNARLLCAYHVRYTRQQSQEAMTRPLHSSHAHNWGLECRRTCTCSPWIAMQAHTIESSWGCGAPDSTHSIDKANRMTSADDWWLTDLRRIFQSPFQIVGFCAALQRSLYVKKPDPRSSTCLTLCADLLQKRNFRLLQYYDTCRYRGASRWLIQCEQYRST